MEKQCGGQIWDSLQKLHGHNNKINKEKMINVHRMKIQYT